MAVSFDNAANAKQSAAIKMRESCAGQVEDESP